MNAVVRPEPRRNVFEAPFWQFVQAHDLRLQRCSECRAYRYPPGPVCAKCLSDKSDWSPLSGSGGLVSWVIFRRQYFPEFPTPYVVVAVETTEGPILIANLVQAGDQELRLDMPMRIVYETARSAAGEEWEIYQWTPA